LSEREVVVGPGEVIDADRDIAACEQDCGCRLHLSNSLLRARKCFFVDEALLRFEPRHVSIAEQGQSPRS
jgi:hypothetical protein